MIPLFLLVLLLLLCCLLNALLTHKGDGEEKHKTRQHLTSLGHKATNKRNAEEDKAAYLL